MSRDPCVQHVVGDERQQSRHDGSERSRDEHDDRSMRGRDKKQEQRARPIYLHFLPFLPVVKRQIEHEKPIPMTTDYPYLR